MRKTRSAISWRSCAAESSGWSCSGKRSENSTCTSAAAHLGTNSALSLLYIVLSCLAASSMSIDEAWHHRATRVVLNRQAQINGLASPIAFITGYQARRVRRNFRSNPCLHAASCINTSKLGKAAFEGCSCRLVLRGEPLQCCTRKRCASHGRSHTTCKQSAVVLSRSVLAGKALKGPKRQTGPASVLLDRSRHSIRGRQPKPSRRPPH